MQTIIKLAREMRVKYLERGTAYREPLPINATKLLNVIAEETGYSINTRVASDLLHLRGQLVRLPDKNALIVISDSNNDNECWKRFTVIKEASHLFTETEETDFNNNAYSQAKALVDLEFQTENLELLWCETKGIIAAIELLIPESMKIKVEHLYNIDGKTTYQIAKLFMVPQRYMEHRMEEWGIDISNNR